MNPNPYVWSWILLVVVVLALAGYRLVVARREDDTLDVLEQDPNVIAEQKLMSKKIDLIDRWGQSLTVLAVVYGIVLVSVYFYRVWLEGGRVQFR